MPDKSGGPSRRCPIATEHPRVFNASQSLPPELFMTIRLDVCASVGAIILGCGAVVVLADAQDSSAPSPAADTSVAPGVDSSSDVAVKKHVEAALQAAKYSLETHVKVSVNKGTVILSGFVLSEWDRRHALEIARKEAGDRKVIDEIHLKEGEAH